MNKYFVKGLVIGTFIGFVITSPRRDEWTKRLTCKMRAIARRAMKSDKT